jgi:oligopeptide/dipeptide ABC transporter ATP-binding protein
VPSIAAMPPGCAFAPRCPHRQPDCERERPALAALDGTGRHLSRCPVLAAGSVGS